MMAHPGRTITTKNIAGAAWPLSLTPAEEKLYRTHYEEGYLPDARYAEWVAVNHPKDAKYPVVLWLPMFERYKSS